MYFLPRNNRIYSAMVHTKPLYRYLLTGCVLSGITYAWYVGIYSRINYAIVQYTTDISGMREQLKSKQSKQVYKKLEVSLYTLQRDVQQYKTGQAADRLQTSMLTFLETMQQHGLILTACSIEKEQTHAEYSTITLTGSFIGSLEQLIKSIQALTQSTALIRWNSITLTPENKNNFVITYSVTLTALS